MLTRASDAPQGEQQTERNNSVEIGQNADSSRQDAVHGMTSDNTGVLPLSTPSKCAPIPYRNLKELLTTYPPPVPSKNTEMSVTEFLQYLPKRDFHVQGTDAKILCYDGTFWASSDTLWTNLPANELATMRPTEDDVECWNGLPDSILDSTYTCLAEVAESIQKFTHRMPTIADIRDTTTCILEQVLNDRRTSTLKKRTVHILAQKFANGEPGKYRNYRKMHSLIEDISDWQKKTPRALNSELDDVCCECMNTALDQWDSEHDTS